MEEKRTCCEAPGDCRCCYIDWCKLFRSGASKVNYKLKRTPLRQYGLYANINQMLDHNLEGQDDKVLNPAELKANQDKDEYEQFMYKYPFYRMDVNGFIFHINNSAAKNSQDRGVTEAHKMLLVDWVYLDDMKNEF